MALEESINLLTAAVAQLTEAILLEKRGEPAAPAPAPAEEKPTTKKKAAAKKKTRGRPKKEEPEPEKTTKADILNVVEEIKALKPNDYRDTLLGILESYGAQKLSEIDESNYDELLEDCKTTLAELEGIGAEEDLLD